MLSTEESIHREMAEAGERAWRARAGCKFPMSGHWCTIRVHLNRPGETRRPNPWRKLVETARERQTQDGKTGNTREVRRMPDKAGQSPITDILLEMRFQRDSIMGVAEFLGRQIVNLENSMIVNGIPIPPEAEDRHRPPAKAGQEGPNRDGSRGDGPEGGTVEARNGEAPEQPEGGKPGRRSAPNPESGQRLEELRGMSKDDTTQAEKRELELLVQIEACPNQKTIMRAIAERTGTRHQGGYRIQISCASILVIEAGRSTMESRPLGNHLRHTVTVEDAGNWIVDRNKNDATFFPDGKPQREPGEAAPEPGEAAPNPQGSIDTMLPLESRAPQP